MRTEAEGSEVVRIPGRRLMLTCRLVESVCLFVGLGFTFRASLSCTEVCEPSFLGSGALIVFAVALWVRDRRELAVNRVLWEYFGAQIESGAIPWAAMEQRFAPALRSTSAARSLVFPLTLIVAVIAATALTSAIIHFAG